MPRQLLAGEADLQLYRQAVLASSHSTVDAAEEEGDKRAHVLYKLYTTPGGGPMLSWNWSSISMLELALCGWAATPGQPHLAILLAEPPMLMVSPLVLQCFVPPSIGRTWGPCVYM